MTPSEKTYTFGCAFQFLPIIPLIMIASQPRNSVVIRTYTNLFAAFMVLSAVLAIVWLAKNRQAPKKHRATMWFALAVNGLCPILGYILIILAWKIP